MIDLEDVILEYEVEVNEVCLEIGKEYLYQDNSVVICFEIDDMIRNPEDGTLMFLTTKRLASAQGWNTSFLTVSVDLEKLRSGTVELYRNVVAVEPLYTQSQILSRNCIGTTDNGAYTYSGFGYTGTYSDSGPYTVSSDWGYDDSTSIIDPY